MFNAPFSPIESLRTMLNFQLRTSYIVILISYILLASCSVQQKISKSATRLIIKDSSLVDAHIGVSIYDPATRKYLYNYQGNKYFVPASNIKIPTCYAGMKYLGDSLVGIRYEVEKDTLYIIGTGDPTLKHPEYSYQPVFDFLNEAEQVIVVSDENWEAERFGAGWAWNDYMSSFMLERSPIPYRNNQMTLEFRRYEFKVDTSNELFFIPRYSLNSSPVLAKPRNYFIVDSLEKVVFKRNFDNNEVDVYFPDKPLFWRETIPFATQGVQSFIELFPRGTILPLNPKDSLTNRKSKIKNRKYKIIHSQPTDSLLKPMMHRSDNFFAEQTLLMVSNEKLSVMNDAKIIDTLLKTDFKELPQKPRWVDGSGLSRYNLFTPQDFVWILNKIKDEFGIERVKTILPTGNEGTLSNYYKADSNYFYAKTGTLSGVVALSGFLYTKKNKLLIFSVLVNNHQGSTTNIRRAVEKFLQAIRRRY